MKATTILFICIIILGATCKQLKKETPVQPVKKFYRIMQVDKDSNVTYSKIITNG